MQVKTAQIFANEAICRSISIHPIYFGCAPTIGFDSQRAATGIKIHSRTIVKIKAAVHEEVKERFSQPV